MIAERINRLVMLIVLLAPIVFGGLATYEYRESSKADSNVSYWRKVSIKKYDECQAMKETSEAWLYSSCIGVVDTALESLDYAEKLSNQHNENFDLYISIAIYVPFATLALYVALMWIWLGKFPALPNGMLSGNQINNFDAWHVVHTHRVTIGYCVLAVVGALFCFVFWENKYVQKMAVGGGVGAFVAIAVVSLKLIFKMK